MGKLGDSPHLLEHALLQQTGLLGRHHKVVSLVLVVDDVLQVDGGLLLQVQEELLVEDECHATDLLHPRLRIRVAVDEVGGDGYGQLSTKLFPLETWNRQCPCLTPATTIVQCIMVSPFHLDVHGPIRH